MCSSLPNGVTRPLTPEKKKVREIVVILIMSKNVPIRPLFLSLKQNHDGLKVYQDKYYFQRK